ncbi:MAG: hypothetical protein ACOX2O_00590 [Bdellovibrionota bacterium]|jgi:hypothetical protein
MNSEVTQNDQAVETTVGELIEAITQIALKSGKTKEEGYVLASLAIEKILTEHGKKLPSYS